MKTIFSVIIFSVLLSCSMFQEENEYQLIYEFENLDETSQKEKVIEVLSKRLSNYGLNFKFDSSKSKDILLTIKADTIYKDRIDNLITNRGKLEFWECYKSKDVLESLLRYDNSLNQGALQELVAFPNVPYDPTIFYCSSENLGVVLENLNKEAFKSFFDNEFKYLKFLKGQPNDIEAVGFFAVKSNEEDKALVTGSDIIKAFQTYNYIDKPTISIEMSEEGGKKWEHMTNDAFVNNTQIAITVNDIVYSAPGVSAGPITGGKSEISGNYTLEEAQDLAAVLSASDVIPKLKLVKFSERKNE